MTEHVKKASTIEAARRAGRSSGEATEKSDRRIAKWSRLDLEAEGVQPGFELGPSKETTRPAAAQA
jgi:hypothetical protein